MHFAGVIIKEKNISVVKAREELGKILIAHELADWYSTGDYRERTFNGKQEISLEDFKIVWEEWKKDDFECMPLILLEVDTSEDTPADFEIYISESYIPGGFYEFSNEYRDRLTALYTEAYIDSIDKLIDTLDVDKYNVCLLDYHY
jgi:replicative superfamily II helicase